MKLHPSLLLITLVLSLLTTSCDNEDNGITDTPHQMPAESTAAIVPGEAESDEDEAPMVVSPLFYQNLLFINHRGLTEYPENTFVAVNAAVMYGFKAVECDICMTKDSVFVLQHDPTIDRCSNGTGWVNELTYEELQAFDFGSWKGSAFAGEPIARLDNLLDYFKAKRLILELDLADESRFKREWIPVIYELVKKKGMLGQTMFTATKDEFEDFLAEPRDIVISVSGVYRMSDAMRALPLKDKVTLCNFSVPHNYLTGQICNYAHENGVLIKTWTTTTQEQNDRCFSLGADYIITEAPLPYDTGIATPTV